MPEHKAGGAGNKRGTGKVCYIHIPKTGGQTLATRMAASFGRDASWVLRADVNNGRQLDQLLAQHDFVEAHMKVGALRRINPAVDLLCTVRHPVEHVKSMFKHILREPRLRLHAPARQLGFAGFVEHYSDHLFNQQALSLVQAFHPRDATYHRLGQNEWLLPRLSAALDRVRWLVPTEQIDDFCRWWPIEAGRPPLPRLARVNVAPAGPDGDGMDALLRANLGRLGLDFALWDAAQSRYDAWRNKVAEQAAPPPNADSPSCAYAEGDDAGIWLMGGWYPRAVRGDGVAEWWAGPSAISEIRVRRRPEHTCLRFEIPAIVHLKHEAITVVDETRDRPLRLRTAPTADAAVMEMTIDLPPEAGPNPRLLIQVPRAGSFIEVNPESTDGQRRSFCSQNWSLGTAPA